MLQPFAELWNSLSARPLPIHIRGLRGSAMSAFWAAAFQQSSQRTLLLTPHKDAAQRLWSDLQTLLGSPGSIAIWPSAQQPSTRQREGLVLERTALLQRFLENPPVWLITYPQALSERLPSPAIWHQQRLTLSKETAIDRTFLIELLDTLSFTETDIVAEPGTYARRGGVLDIFSYGHLYPARIRFEGDTITKLQRFDIESQISQTEILVYHLIPSPSLAEHSDEATLLDYLPADTTIGILDGLGVWAAAERLEDVVLLQALEQLRTRIIQTGGEPVAPAATIIEYPTILQASFPHDFGLLRAHFQELPIHTLYLFIENERQRPRLERLLQEWDLSYRTEWVIGKLAEGFVVPGAYAAYYTEHQIFKRFYQPAEHRSFRRGEALVPRDLETLSVGDYVVHKQYGIAKFGGLGPMPQGGGQEAVKLIFAEDAVLYVPTYQLSEIARYRSVNSTPPKLSRLGSQEWKRTTERIRHRIREVAIDLVRLYAQRKVAPGYAYGADTLAQMEMEARFPYEETPDQWEAIADVKRDMEAPHPMDRLICGDVGFGKTEVAIRAAFKAVQEGMQVAMLVPTTVLAMQHSQTFRERLKDWPIRMATMSRLQSPKTQKTLLQALSQGEIDIVIGTHRLLSDDIKFKDLGLLIIDEEHRFGVVDKEKLRTKWPLVDTLSLSATPIPRTLQMALSGLRDVSIIRTPPKGRLPVSTHIATFSWELVKEVIERELQREGQVFFVHHAIEGLKRIVEKLRELIPEAEVAFVHAQLPAREIETVLTAFLARQVDILVSTPVVESGLDVPHANTMLIYPAHRFGLSELHQLRGRVGRRDIQAYCYLLVPSLHHLSPEALRRLETLEEFSDLGAGFQIAMRDLEIRGAGDFFGAEQSGFIHAVGYDYYQELLEEAIAEIKAELQMEDLRSSTVPKGPRCSVEADWPAQLPPEWVPHPAARLEIYRQFSTTPDEAELQAYLRTLLDRFGDLPEPVLTLADILRLRWEGDRLGVKAIRIHKQQMRIEFLNSPPVPLLLQALYALRGFQFSLSSESPHLSVTLRPIRHSKEALAILGELWEHLCREVVS